MVCKIEKELEQYNSEVTVCYKKENKSLTKSYPNYPIGIDNDFIKAYYITRFLIKHNIVL